MSKGVKKIFQVAIFGSLMLSLAFTGCTPAATQEVTTASPEAAAAISKVGGTLVLASTEEPDTLDVQKSSFAITDMVGQFIGVALVSKDTKGNYIPYMAESWETSEDGLTWTFHLRQDVKFHNGDLVTAKDWVYTFNRAKDPNFVSPVTAQMLAPVTSIEAKDDYTLLITLNEPYYYFLDNLTDSGYMGVISQRAVEEAGDKYGTTEGGAVGAGPYMFKEWVQDEKIVLTRNPDYNWGPVNFEGANTGAYSIENIEFRIMPDYATILAGLESGEISYASLTPKDVAGIESTGLYNILSNLATGLNYLEFNLSKPPFDDLNVRKAFSYAIDRETIVQVVLSGEGQKALTPLSPGMPGYSADIEQYAYDYDPAKAKEAFEAAGYTYNADNMLEKDGQPFEVTLDCTSDETTLKMAQILVSQFETVGVKATIQSSEWGALAEKLTAGDYNVTVMGYSYSSPDILTIVFNSKSGWWSKINDPEFDTLLQLTRTEMDPIKNQAAIDAAQKYEVEHSYMLPMANPISFAAIDKNITGHQYYPLLGLLLQNAYFTNLP